MSALSSHLWNHDFHYSQEFGEGPTEISGCVDADDADMNLSLCKIYVVVFIGQKTQAYWQELVCEVTATGAGARA